MNEKIKKSRVYDKIKITNDEKFTIPETSSIFCNGGATFRQGITIGNNNATSEGSIRYNTELERMQYKTKNNWFNLVDIKSDLQPPTTSTSPGNMGDVSFDNNYIYLCIQNNVWKRASLSSW